MVGGAASVLAALALRFPATGALGNLVLTLVWYSVGYTSAAIHVPYLVAFYLLGTTGDRRRQFGVGGVAVVGASVAMLVGSDESAVSAASAVGWTLVALVFGELGHSRRALMAEYQARAIHAEAERDREADRRVAETRLEIARDLHDVLAHTVSVMTVQAGVGQDALRRGGDGAEAALRTIRSAGKEAMSEIRALVAVLRSGSDPLTAPAPRLEHVRDLVDVATAAGLEVDAEIDLEGVELSDVVELTAYRIIQEGLTNVVRHASASRVVVRVCVAGPFLRVRVHDDGSLIESRPGVGFGITGMRERVEALAGTLRAGADPAGGWLVEARLPRERR